MCRNPLPPKPLYTNDVRQYHVISTNFFPFFLVMSVSLQPFADLRLNQEIIILKQTSYFIDSYINIYYFSKQLDLLALRLRWLFQIIYLPTSTRWMARKTYLQYFASRLFNERSKTSVTKRNIYRYIYI